jgi:pyruvate formate lyase activating enzyme
VELEVGYCISCNRSSNLISEELCVCADCIRSHFDEVKPHLEEVHGKMRRAFDLPERPPKEKGGVPCAVCVNRCVIPEGERGYCGVRLNKNGELLGGTKKRGNFSFYKDPLPTNCVGSWVCPAGSSCGYPRYSYKEGAEYGYKNLAVFFHACSFDCIFCQNWHYREHSTSGYERSPDVLADNVDPRTSCICYFGGDPTPQLGFAIEASKLALSKTKSILRICWETNGSMNAGLLKEMIMLSLGSGGCLKFDLKAWDEGLHRALTGVTNRQTLKNFEQASKYCKMRDDPPLLIASTLLVPGYIGTKEVSSIAKFIASLDASIPYSLLAFGPGFYMHDLPYTSKKDAYACLDAAHEAGLVNVRIGNIHILR